MQAGHRLLAAKKLTVLGVTVQWNDNTKSNLRVN